MGGESGGRVYLSVQWLVVLTCLGEDHLLGTMWVPDPNILVVRRPPPFREGRDLDHHVSACSVGARACWGAGGVPGLLSVWPHFCWG